LTLLAGAEPQRGHRTGVSLEGQRERELALAAERAYQRLVADWQAGGAARSKGADAALGRASRKALAGPGSATD